MKRIVAILTLSTIFILSGCNNQTQDLPEVSKAHVRVTSTVATVTRPAESENIPETTEEAIEQREGATFRNAIWGDDIDTVKKYETEIALKKSDNDLIGETAINGYDAIACYYFNNNKLYKGVYDFSPLKYSSGGQFITAYNSLKNTLTKKYGEPYEDEIFNNENQSLIEHAGPSSALKYGYVTYIAQWKTDDSEILIGMMSVDYKIGLVISYTDINYEPDINDSGL